MPMRAVGARVMGRASRVVTREVGIVMVALVVVVVLASVTLSSAFTPQSFDPAIGGAADPQVRASMTHSQVGGREPKQGESFTYTATLEFANMGEPGTTQETTFAIALDENAPAERTPARGDFQTSNAQISDLTCTTTSCTGSITFTGATGGVSVRIPARVNEGLEDGTIVRGSVNAGTTVTPNIALVDRGKTYTADNGTAFDCAGTWTFKMGLTAGAWLADIKFADAEGQGKVSYDDTPLTLNTSADQNGLGRDQLAVFDAQGRNITDQIENLEGSMTWKASDPTPPTRPQATIPAGARWLSSANWPVDTQTFTGNTWLPAGSTVVVTKHGHFNACFGGFAADFDPTRPAGMALEVLRPVTDAGNSAITSFTMPGEPKPILACQSNIWFTEATQAAIVKAYGRDVGYLDEIGNGTTKSHAVTYNNDGKYGTYTQALAISEKHPERLYSVAQYSTRVPSSERRSRYKGLLYYDLNSSDRHVVQVKRSVEPKWDEVVGLTFDSHGVLWATEGRVLWSLDVDDPNANWISHGQLSLDPLHLNDQYVYDIVFDKAGNLYYLSQFSTRSGGLSVAHGEIHMLDAAEVSAGTGSSYRYRADGTKMLEIVDGGSGFYAMAWGSDGKLYVGRDTGAMYRVTPNQTGWTYEKIGTPTKVNTIFKPSSNNANYRNSAFHDFASCNYGDPVPPQSGGPRFQVSKSVIDPSTHQVVEAGQASSKPAQVRADGTVVVDYVVSVANSGNASGTPSRVNDTVRIPSGFELVDVALDGVSQGADPSLSFQPGVLASGAVETHRVRVRAKAADLGRVDWDQAQTCGTLRYDAYDGGFFNQVTMDGDSDGTGNNFGCAPVRPQKPTAHLRLVKRIVDENGSDLPRHADKARQFQLTAFKADAGMSLSGAASAGQAAVDAAVLPGTYALSEALTSDAADGNFTKASEWSCVNRGSRMVVTDGTVTLADNDDVTCTIANTLSPTFKVVKTATAHDGTANEHIGQTVEANGEGVYRARYDITVTNMSEDLPGTSGAVYDSFAIPAGMVWGTNMVNQDESVDVDIERGSDSQSLTVRKDEFVGSSSDPTGGTSHAYELSRGEQLAPGASVTYHVSIPLKADGNRGNSGASVFDDHAASLKTCTPDARSGNVYTTKDTGVVNETLLVGEDHAYSTGWEKDNVACVPVEGTTPPVPQLPPLPLTGGTGSYLFVAAGAFTLVAGSAGALARSYRRRRLAR